MPIRPPEFDAVAEKLAPNLASRGRKLIAINGAPLAGKTTLGRFLAWYFNATLIESDQYLKGDGTMAHDLGTIKLHIDARLNRKLMVFIEGATVLRTLRDIDRKPDLLVYVENTNDLGADSLAEEMAAYDTEFKPKASADVLIQVSHEG